MRLDFGAKIIIDLFLVSDRVPWSLYSKPVVGTRDTDKLFVGQTVVDGTLVLVVQLFIYVIHLPICDPLPPQGVD